MSNVKFQDTLKAAEKEMNELFFERREEIRGLIVGLLTGNHICLIGPPGTAKSALASNLCSRFDGEYFRYLLTPFTLPHELLGFESLQARKMDVQKYITTNKLPEANVALLDEIFKANSSTLNCLLTILNEKMFFNEGKTVDVPLQMAIGASNELPDSSEQLSALWDRFSLKFIVDYIREPGNFAKFMEQSEQHEQHGINISSHHTVKIDPLMLSIAQAEVKNVDVSKVHSALATLRNSLYQKGIRISERKMFKAMALVKAAAWLEGKTAATEEDLEILVHCVWDDPSQISDIRQVIMQMAGPYWQKIRELTDECVELYKNVPQDVNAATGQEPLIKIKKNLQEMEQNVRNLEYEQKISQAERGKEEVDRVKGMYTELSKRIIGI